MLWQDKGPFQAPPPVRVEFQVPSKSYPARRALSQRSQGHAPVAARPVPEMGLHRDPVPDVARWLGHLYRLCKEGKRGPAVDQVLDGIDELLLLRNTSRCDEILKAAEVDRLMVEVLLALLMETFRARSVLMERDGFYDRVEDRLRRERPNKVEALLRGLR